VIQEVVECHHEARRAVVISLFIALNWMRLPRFARNDVWTGAIQVLLDYFLNNRAKVTILSLKTILILGSGHETCAVRDLAWYDGDSCDYRSLHHILVDG